MATNDKIEPFVVFELGPQFLQAPSLAIHVFLLSYGLAVKAYGSLQVPEDKGVH